MEKCVSNSGKFLCFSPQKIVPVAYSFRLSFWSLSIGAQLSGTFHRVSSSLESSGTCSLDPVPTQSNPYSLVEGVEFPQCFSHDTIGLETNS